MTEQVGERLNNLMQRALHLAARPFTRKSRCRSSYPSGGLAALSLSVTRLLPVTLHIQSLQILLGGWGRGHPWPARHLSRIRRSRLVGRPAPRSRAATGTEEVGGGAGVRSR